MMKPEDLLAIIKDTVKSMFTELANKLFKLGTIPASYTTGDPTVLFEGETVVSAKAYPSLYQPSPGDRVLLVRVGSTWILLGRVSDSTWQEPAFENGWVNFDSGYNTAGYMKDTNGFVHLRGMVKLGAVGTPIFTLPIGYRPSYRQLFVTISGSALGRCDVTTAGQTIAQTGSNSWFSLDGITFKAEQ